MNALDWLSKGKCTKAKLDAFLDEYVRWLQTCDQTDRGGAVVQARVSAAHCRQVKTDRKAELVRAGIRLGRDMDSLDRDVFWLDGVRRRQKKGLPTKAANLAERNRGIVSKYRKLVPTMGDLKARQEIRRWLTEKYRAKKDKQKPYLSLEQITAIIKKAESE